MTSEETMSCGRPQSSDLSLSVYKQAFNLLFATVLGYYVTHHKIKTRSTARSMIAGTATTLCLTIIVAALVIIQINIHRDQNESARLVAFVPGRMRRARNRP